MENETRRYVILGAGAVGAGLGGRLFEHGHDVVLVARGEHLEVIRREGLRLGCGRGEVTLRVPAVAAPDEIDWRRGDVVVLAVKSQDTEGALRSLALVAPASTPVVCAQNGVSNEPAALRWFDNVYGAGLQMPCVYLEPGRVFLRSAPVSGVLDIGRYPRGSDEVAQAIAADLAASSFICSPVEDVMRFKYRKLLRNLQNSVHAALGPGKGGAIAARARDEALAVFAAAGIAIASDDEDGGRRDELMTRDAVPGYAEDPGSSSWQSLARGTGSIEADYLNGEIARLGRLHGVPVPVNAALQRVANRLAVQRAAPGSLTETELLVEIGASG